MADVKQHRMEWLDAMRGFTMILVVSYHVAQMGFGESEKLSASLPFLVLFRMPLFFFVSGFLAYKSKWEWTPQSFASLTWKKMKVQVLPALVFLCVFLVLKGSDTFTHSFAKAMCSPTKGGYWFTWVLLQMFLIYYVFAYIEQKLNVRSWIPITLLWISSLAIYATLYMPKECGNWWKNDFMMQSSLFETCKFFHFFLMGNIVHRYWRGWQHMFDHAAFFPTLAVLAFICCADIFRWHTMRFEWTNLPKTTAMYTLMFIVLTFFRHYKDWFGSDTRLGRSLQYIGTRTLDIYLLHFILLPSMPEVGKWLNANQPNFVIDVVMAVSVALVVIAFCLLISNILRISPTLRLYLFGVRADSRKQGIRNREKSRIRKIEDSKNRKIEFSKIRILEKFINASISTLPLPPPKTNPQKLTHPMTLSPVAMFVYNRKDNTQQTIEHLLANTLAKDTELYVFSDGGKNDDSWKAVNDVRHYLHEVKTRVDRDHLLKSMTIVERPENIYLERNITEGIAQVFETHDRIIVLEDDIVTSPYYLQYMNDAFTLYQDTPKVMHVAGFTNLSIDDGPGFYFTPHMSGWGWGTWRDRWQSHFVHYKTRSEALQGMTDHDCDTMQYGGVFPCLKSLDKNPIPWDICWEIAIYKAGGLCLTPAHTMVRNIGLKNGTHFKSFDLLQWYEFDREPQQAPLPLTEVPMPTADPHTEQLFAEAIRDWGIRYTPLGKAVRAIYKLLTHKAQRRDTIVKK